MSFGIYLKTLRTGVMTQRELAERIGVSHTYISKIENNVEKPPNEKILVKIANELNVDKYKLMIAADIMPYEYKNMIKENQELLDYVKIAKDTACFNKREDELKVQKSFFRQLFENNAEGVILTDNVGKIVWVNNSFTKIEGYEATEVIGNSYELLNSYNKNIPRLTEIRQSIFENGVWKGKSLGKRKNGEIYNQMLNIIVIKNDRGNITNFTALISDITEEKIKEEKIYNLAFKDSLTSLYNRAFFLEKLDNELIISKENKEKMGLLFIDFDGFKRINDNLGNSTGDKLLKMIAERLKKCIDETHTIARMGGDEFAVLLSQSENVESLVYIAEKISFSLREPFFINENEIYMSASIGIAVYPDDGINGDELISRADIALNRAKKDSKNKIQVYSHELDEETKKGFIIENNLRYALDRNELYINYQPIIDVKTKQIICAEVLLRWNNIELGFVPPDRFIHIAESTGLIIPIGEWVLKTACEQNKKWQDAGYKPISIAVNISVRQLENIGFVESVENILKATNLDPKYLELEITESVAIKDINNTIKILKNLNDLGIKWSIDDFGTGYSSLGQLNKIAINTLKIDKTFVNDIVENNDSEIASAIISMAHKLKLSVVAEGVETENQLDFLRNNKCDMAQGYLFSKPIDENMFEKLILCEVKR